MSFSAVAGILDCEGGLRVVVGPADTLQCHLTEGERLFVLPGLRVKEPVTGNGIPNLITRVECYVNLRLKQER